MAARFLFLKNKGTPTKWDSGRYFRHLTNARQYLPADLISLTAEERYSLPSYSDLSFWHSVVTQIEVNGDSIRVIARNDNNSRRFEFLYTGVKRVHSTQIKFHAMPWLIIQELVVMRNGLFRHTYSDIGGDITTIYSSSLSFQDSVLQ
jgi:hypothetical protein